MFNTTQFVLLAYKFPKTLTSHFLISAIKPYLQVTFFPSVTN